MPTLKHMLTASLLVGLSTVSTVALAQAKDIMVSFKDGVVTPNQIEVKANTNVKIIVQNNGKSAGEFESKLLHIEKVVPAGAKVTILIRNIAPGKYKFVDEFTEDKPSAHGIIIAK